MAQIGNRAWMRQPSGWGRSQTLRESALPLTEHAGWGCRKCRALGPFLQLGGHLTHGPEIMYTLFTCLHSSEHNPCPLPFLQKAHGN